MAFSVVVGFYIFIVLASNENCVYDLVHLTFVESFNFLGDKVLCCFLSLIQECLGLSIQLRNMLLVQFFYIFILSARANQWRSLLVIIEACDLNAAG